MRDSLFENVHQQLKLGITSVIEAGSSVDPNVVGSYAEWELCTPSTATNCRAPRCRSSFPTETPRSGDAKLKEFGRKTGDGNERLRVGSIGEMAADGGFHWSDGLVAGGLQRTAGIPRPGIFHSGADPRQHRSRPQAGLAIRNPRHRRRGYRDDGGCI